MKKFTKKILMAALIVSAAYSNIATSAPNYTEGKEYSQIATPVVDAPEVVEFFSFYCPHCYDFETKYMIPQAIKESLPEGKKLTKSHVNFMGGISDELTEAWSIANVLDKQEEIGPKIFDAIHKQRNLKSRDDIIKIFEGSGVTKDEYEQLAMSFIVKSQVKRQQDLQNLMQVTGVPSFYVKGKYQIDATKFGTNDIEQIRKMYADVTTFLLSQE